MEHQRPLGLGLAALALAGAGGCGATRVAAERRSPGGPRQAVAAPGPRTISVGCTGAVSNPGETWPDHWPDGARNAIVAGPIAWPDARRLASDYQPGGGTSAGAYATFGGLALQAEALVAVTGGAAVRVRIPANERSRLSLDYTGLQPRNAAGRYQVSDGASQVTFTVCPRRPKDRPSSLFEGGFIVAGAQCARIDVYTDTTRRPIERRIAFGVRTSTCRPTA